MDRFDIVSERIAASAEDSAYDEMSDVKDIYTDFGGSKLVSKRVSEKGSTVEFDAVVEFDKLAYIPSFKGGSIVAKYGESIAVSAFLKVVRDMKHDIVRKIAKKYKDNPPLFRVLGETDAHGYENPSVSVSSVKFSSFGAQHGEIFVSGTVRLTLTVTKLPDLDVGPYDGMTDKELRKWILAWGSYAPEDFWMDGEYRGSENRRVLELMKRWRAMPPHAQVKHFQGLKRLV